MPYDLDPVVEAIKAGDKLRARQLLRPMLKNPTADVLYLAARVTDSREQVIRVLRQALQLDPAHKKAARTLAILTQAPIPASPTAPLLKAPPQDQEPPEPITPVFHPAEPTQHGSTTEPEKRLLFSPHKPLLPSVPEAVSARAYRLSGHYSSSSLALVAGAGLVLGAAVGAIAYWGGVLVITPLAGGVLNRLAALSAEVGLTTLAGLVILIAIGLTYPILLSRMLGSALWPLVRLGKIRHRQRVFLLTLVSAVVSYSAFVLLAMRNSGMLHTTSGVFRVFFDLHGTPWWLYLVVAAEALLWIVTATYPATRGVEKLPFSEEHGVWYDRRVRTATVRANSAGALLAALETQNAHRLRGVILADRNHFPRLELTLRKCPATTTADYQLTAAVCWQEPEEGKPDRSGKARITIRNKKENWLDTMILAALGSALENILFGDDAD